MQRPTMAPFKLSIEHSLGLDLGELKAVDHLLDMHLVFQLKDFEGPSFVSLNFR